MITFKKVNLNCPYYFFSNMTNMKDFNPNLLRIDKISRWKVLIIKILIMKILFILF